MNRQDPTATWIRPLRRFLSVSEARASRPQAAPRVLPRLPLWYERLGAVLIILALIQGARVLDGALLAGSGKSPETARSNPLDAGEWHAWSQRRGLPGPSTGDRSQGMIWSRGDLAIPFDAGRAGELVASATGGLDPTWMPWQRLGSDARPHRFVRIEVTGYSSRICETDSTPTVTAAGTITEIGTIALSRDLLRTFTPGAPFDFGDKVLIPGLGVFEVWDTMNARWTRKADIWFDSTDRALRFGRRFAFIAPVEESTPTLANLLP